MTKRNTKSELLDHGVQLLLDQGFYSTGIQDVLKAAAVPKGSFYHHFDSKEAFGLQVAKQYSEDSFDVLDQMLSDKDHVPLERLRLFFESVFSSWNSDDCKHGCLLGNLGQELADVNEPFRLLIARTLDRWSSRFAECLTEAQDRGELSDDLDVMELSEMLLDGFEGAALRMKVAKSPVPLDRFMKFYFEHVLVS